MKKMLRKGVLITAIAIILTLAFTITGFALDVSFSNEKSSEVLTGVPSLSLLNEDAYKNVVGYRFSVINNEGKIMGHACDVYNNEWIGYYADDSMRQLSYKEFYAVDGQNSKMYWQNNYSKDRDFMFKPISSIANYSYIASQEIDSSLPRDTSKVIEWLSRNDYFNADSVYDLCGANFIEEHNLVVEPLIQCVVNSRKTVLTITEIAVLGGTTYNDFDNIPAVKVGEMSILNDYILRSLPNLLTVNKDNFLWDKVTEANLASYRKYTDLGEN